MGLTVFAEGQGLFHKGSGGKGIAPADVCLSPPPPPAGPIPIPYVNNLMASDLSDGSTTFKADGEPTALEDKSSISTSMGDEAGTQGGNVVTHKTKGKGYFTLWSFTVKVEGKGVCRNGDMMGQNCASSPPGCIDAAAVTKFESFSWVDTEEPCTKPYSRDCAQPPSTPNSKQKKQANEDAASNGGCWNCPNTVTEKANWTADHQPPLNVAWYMGGCNDPEQFKEWAHSLEATGGFPHCHSCYPSQGGKMGGVSRWVKSNGIPSQQALMQKISNFLM